jgi:hypothetical protein
MNGTRANEKLRYNCSWSFGFDVRCARNRGRWVANVKSAPRDAPSAGGLRRKRRAHSAPRAAGTSISIAGCRAPTSSPARRTTRRTRNRRRNCVELATCGGALLPFVGRAIAFDCALSYPSPPLAKARGGRDQPRPRRVPFLQDRPYVIALPLFGRGCFRTPPDLKIGVLSARFPRAPAYGHRRPVPL